MIKTVTATDALQMVREGKEVYYFDTDSKEVAPLSKVFESVPGVFLVEDSGEPIEITIPAADEPEKKGKQGRKINLDMGKVKALRDAGWPIYKIADEMGVSAPTISYHLKHMGSEVQSED